MELNRTPVITTAAKTTNNPTTGTALSGIRFFLGMACTLAGFGIFGIMSHNNYDKLDTIVYSLLFGAPGAYVILETLYRMIQKSRRKTAPRSGTPWESDYKWDPQKGASQNQSLYRKQLAIIIFWTAIVGLVNYLAYGPFEHKFLQFIAGIGIFFAGSYIIYIIYRSIQHLKYGSSLIRYDSFPFYTGSTAGVTWVLKRGLGRYKNVTFTLRRIEETVVSHGRSSDNNNEVAAMQVWASIISTVGEGEHHPGEDIHLNFEIPENSAGTDLRAGMPVYWELEVNAATPGVNFRDRYLVPIYGKQP